MSLPLSSRSSVWIDMERYVEGAPTRMPVWDVRDDDDYGEPTRRMIVAAPTAEAAEAMWDCPFTEHNVYARPVRLKMWQLEVPGEARVLHTYDLQPAADSEAA